MNYIKTAVLILIISLVINACKKDKQENPVVYPSYSALKAGNFWIYERFTVDTLGNATSQNIFDSVYAEKDTVINNQTFYKVIKDEPHSSNIDYFFVRDSLHYTIGLSGKPFSLYLASNPVSETFITNGADTVARIVTSVEDRDVTITTPAGNFVTTDLRKTYYMYPGFEAGGNPRVLHARYAANIGLVLETLPFYVSNPNYTERRLVRYKVD